ncbi:MAG: trans-sulfuration enzyme family protein [Leptonema sp. (in: bacteria)]
MKHSDFIHLPLLKNEYNSLNVPLYTSSVFLFSNIEELIEFVSKKEKSRFEYSRYGNPTNKNLEIAIANLEKAEDATLFSSGMSACTIPFLAILEKGDHIVITSDMYLKTFDFLRKILVKFGIECSVVFPNAEQIIQAIRPQTKVVFTEFPTNPFYHIVDLGEISRYLKEKSILFFVDSTLASPYNCNPILYGADLVIHSLTKYFSGNNDLIGGVVAGKKSIIEKIREFNGYLGAILPAEISFNILRSIKTMPLRVSHQNQKTLEIAEFLEKHPKIKKVYYPFLESSPYYELSKKYLKGGGCLLTIELYGNLETLKTFCNSLKIFKIGPSFASAESLIDPPYIMSHWDVPEEEKIKMNIKETTLRISVGFEDLDDLIKDLSNALEKI